MTCKWNRGRKEVTHRLFLCSFNSGAVATGEDPTSVAIASIQSAATFPDPNVKYVFRTENGGQVREGARWLQVFPVVGLREVIEPVKGRPGLEDEVKMWTPGVGGGIRE